MGISEVGKIGYWEIVHPSYTIFNKETETFSGIWTKYQADFSKFYTACSEDIKTYQQSKTLFPKKRGQVTYLIFQVFLGWSFLLST